MASDIKVALIQLYSKPFDVAGNYARAEEYIRKAAAQGADLAVLPEYHLQSWKADAAALLAAAQASTPYLARYRSLARELRLAIVPGTILEPITAATATTVTATEANQGIANVAYFIGPDGEVLGRYQKKNLWHPERPVLVADAETPHAAFDTPWGRFGLLVCWDLAFPEAMRELVVDGARYVVCPTCWLASDNGAAGDTVNPDSERVFIESVVVARAFENAAAFIFCNAGGPTGGGGVDEQGQRFLGLSQVGMPMLGAVGKVGAEEDMSVVRVEGRVLDVAEDAYKVRADIAREGWHYSYKK